MNRTREAHRLYMREYRAGLKRLNAPLESCPVWQSVKSDHDAKFPWTQRTSSQILDRHLRLYAYKIIRRRRRRRIHPVDRWFLLTVVCPHCKGDGCDPCDYSTLIVAECPVCDGQCRVTQEVADLVTKGMGSNWTWEQFQERKKQLNG